MTGAPEAILTREIHASDVQFSYHRGEHPCKLTCGAVRNTQIGAGASPWPLQTVHPSY